MKDWINELTMFIILYKVILLFNSMSIQEVAFAWLNWVQFLLFIYSSWFSMLKTNMQINVEAAFKYICLEGMHAVLNDISRF